MIININSIVWSSIVIDTDAYTVEGGNLLQIEKLSLIKANYLFFREIRGIYNEGYKNV